MNIRKYLKTFFLVSEHETPLIDTNTCILEKKNRGMSDGFRNLVDIKIYRKHRSFNRKYIA